MKWRYAHTLDDAELVRVIRNGGREWFADVAEITAENQAEWWRVVSALPTRDFICILASSNGDRLKMGYGMLQRRAGNLWVSLAVDVSHRGDGLGTKIYGLLPTLTTEPVYAGILVKNIASRRAADKAGYRTVSVPPIPDVPPACQRDWVIMKGPDTT